MATGIGSVTGILRSLSSSTGSLYHLSKGAIEVSRSDRQQEYYMKKIICTTIITMIIIPLVLFAGGNKDNTDHNSGLVYGHGHSFWIRAPKGWVLDNESGTDMGLHAVFYPEGSSWAQSIAVMYVNTAAKTNESVTINQIISYDIENFKSKSPNLKVVDKKSIILPDKKKVIVNHFSGDSHGNYEAIGYLDESKVVVMFVLTSRNEKEFNKSLKAFEELVKSYEWLTGDVKIEGKGK